MVFFTTFISAYIRYLLWTSYQKCINIYGSSTRDGRLCSSKKPNSMSKYSHRNYYLVSLTLAVTHTAPDSRVAAHAPLILIMGSCCIDG